MFPFRHRFAYLAIAHHPLSFQLTRVQPLPPQSSLPLQSTNFKKEREEERENYNGVQAARVLDRSSFCSPFLGSLRHWCRNLASWVLPPLNISCVIFQIQRNITCISMAQMQFHAYDTIDRLIKISSPLMA